VVGGNEADGPAARRCATARQWHTPRDQRDHVLGEVDGVDRRDLLDRSIALAGNIGVPPMTDSLRTGARGARRHPLSFLRRGSALPSIAAATDVPVGIARTRTFFPELEALRGVAVSLVFLFHVNAIVVLYQRDAPHPVPTALGSFVLAGHTGVDLFFVLSGFLLGLPFIADGLGERRVSVRTFFARRALRILPLYYVAVAVAVVLMASRARDLLVALPYLFFLNNIPGVVRSLLPYSVGWWSLATELEFYLVLPILPFALRTRRGRIVGALGLVAYALGYWAMVVGWLHAGVLQGTLMGSAFARGPVFLWGIAAAWLYHVAGERVRRWCADSAWLRYGGADALLAATLMGLAFFLRWTVETRLDYGAGMGQTWHIANGAFWVTVLLLVMLAPLRSKPLLCNPALGRLGVVSYSIYLTHYPLLHWGMTGARAIAPDLVGWTARTTLTVAVLSLACYAVATLTYTWIERPFLMRKSRV
jgi:peptidoglycan/LPS O-acetylase OafA/YrhL